MRVRGRNLIGIVTLTLMLALMLFACYVAFTFKGDVPATTTINLAFDVFGIIICTVIFASTLLDQHISTSTIIFMSILALEELLLFWDIESWVNDGNVAMIQYVKITNYYLYGFQLIVLPAYWLYLKELYSDRRKQMRKLSLIIYSIFAIGVILIVTNPWTELFFFVDDEAHYRRASTYALSYLAPYSMMVVCLYAILKFETKRRRKAALLSYIFVPVIAAVIQSFFYGISLQIIFMLFAIVLMYTNIYIDRSAELIRNETELAEQRASVMVSQIQPHFMYNALTSIMNIKGNPPGTVDAVADFGKYMRGNLDSISQINPVPITREIDQLECYINLRKIKYGSRIEVIADIGDSGFFIPPMTVKTIVGSAIDCRVNDPDFQFTCRIYTDSNERNHVLVIQDDFPSEEALKYSMRVDQEDQLMLKARLRTMVGGNIENVMENGLLKVVITIPRTAKVI